MATFSLKVGMRVRYQYNHAAISCCWNGVKIRGEGTIRRIRKPDGEPNVELFTGIRGSRTCVFPHEITKILTKATGE